MRQDLEQTLIDVRAALDESDGGRLASRLEEVHPADLADIYTVLKDDQRSQLVFLLPPRATAALIAELDEAERSEAVDDIDDADLSDVVTELEPDDAADVLSELTDVQREYVLEQLPDDQSDQLEELLEFDEESAGGIMTPELVALPMVATVKEAVEAVRQAAEEADVHYVYTVDDQNRLVGLVQLRQLVTNREDTSLASISVEDPVVVHVDDDQEDVANKMRKYDLTTVPVIDGDGRLRGQITHDDVLDIAEEEAAEDIYLMAGTAPEELEEPSSVRAAFIRLRWLLACMIGTGVSGLIVGGFNQSFPEKVYLALVMFVPMMGAMGGNSGIQISTIIIRALATGDLASTKVRLAFARELPITLIMSPVCGVSAALITFLGVPFLKSWGLVDDSVPQALMTVAVGVGMSVAIMTASLLGMSLPYLFRKFGVDPAIASGPIVTTTNDIVSVLAYFLVAMSILSNGATPTELASGIGL
ncbi:MAG: magnesium transporter MgtE [Phycisphaerae bacterium]|nr:MAG: magnesium transporter MgtE [Phycisphaerae bacterium]